MSKKDLTAWYVAGLKAINSACEQGTEAASQSQKQFSNPEAKQIATDVAEMTARHNEIISGFINDAGEKVHDFKDRIMEGIAKGSELSMKAVTDDAVKDVALVLSGQTAIHYFIVAFSSQAAIAKVLGMDDQAEVFKRMSDENKVIDLRYTQPGETTINKKAVST